MFPHNRIEPHGINLVRDTFVSRLSLHALTFLCNVLIARLLGPEGKGIVTLSLFWSFLLANFSTFGTENGFIYFSSREPASLKRFISLALILAITVGGVVGGAFGALMMVTNLFENTLMVTLASGMVPLYVATLLISSAFTGVGLLKLVNLSLIASWIFILGILVCLSYWNAACPESVLVVYATGQAVHISILLYYSKRPRLVMPKKQLPLLGRTEAIFAYSLKTFPGALSSLLQLSSIMLILGFVSGKHEVGIYSVAASFINVLCLLPIAVGTVLMPRLAYIESSKAVRTTGVAIRVSLLATLLLATLTSMVASFLIPWIYGLAFSHSVVVIYVMIPAALTYSMSKVISTYFNGINKPWVSSLGSLFGFFTVCISGIFLGARWGSLGAGVAMTLASLCSSVWLIAKFCIANQISLGEVLLPRFSDINMVIRVTKPLWVFNRFFKNY